MPHCHAKSEQPVSFIEFRPRPQSRTGFAVSQFLQYKLDTDAPERPNEPATPERLELGFSTADVIVRGARLAPLVNLLTAHQLSAVESLATDFQGRYVNLYPTEPWVAWIGITSLDKSGP